MANTVNYGWTKPTEGGSTGAWDTILNAAIDEIDAQVKVVENKADENLAFPILPAAMHGFSLGVPGDDLAQRNLTSVQLNDPGSVELVIPISGLALGMQITGFKSRGQATTGATTTVELRRQDTSGGDALISSHTHTATLATVTKTGLLHSVGADSQYYFLVTLDRGASGTPLIQWVQPTVERI